MVVIALDLATLFFTLTRGVWIGASLGILIAMSMTRQTRRILVPLAVIGLLAVGATLAVSPTIRSEALGRAESQSPVWDRQNTDLAALRMVAEKPLTGVGWENFINEAPNYMVQQPGYPISGEGIEVHNVFLSHAAELGIPGLLLWLAGFAGAVRRGLLPGQARHPPGRRLWAGRAGPGVVAPGWLRHHPLLLGHRRPGPLQPGPAQHAALDVVGDNGDPLHQPAAGAGTPGPLLGPAPARAGTGRAPRAGAGGPRPGPGLILARGFFRALTGP